MLLRDLIELKREECKTLCKENEQEYTRQWILSFQSYGIDKEEYKTALQIALPDSYNYFISWQGLKQLIYEYYLIDIGEEENPNIQEVYNCWLNLDTMELSTVKTFSPFDSFDNCVMVKDYRILGDTVSWQDLVIQ